MAKALNWDKDRVRRQIADGQHEALMQVYSRTARRTIRAAVMPWGKHKGRRLSAIPHDYLTWLHGVRPEDCPLRHAIAVELFRRQRCARPHK